jgi:ataxia telangiectasia mutated family protein
VPLARLRQLVDRMCAEHPYHVLYHVQALKRGDRVGGSGCASELFSAPREKIDAARDALDAFARHSEHHSAMVWEMDAMIEAYVDLARHPVDSARGRGGDGSYQIPSRCKKRALRALRLVPVVTATLPVDPTMRYAEGSFPSFSHFSDTCRLVGGINQPKLVEAHASDGGVYKQLAKAGNDDLRQDAVMQQLFELVNTLLLDDSATRARRLGVGTYRVVPFTPAAGVLEWVENTTLLSEYLIGGGTPGDAHSRPVRGAHERYRPWDLKSRECRERLANCHTREQLREAYDEVCENFKPVMHHFFLENFPSPRAWWESRLTYTRSVAVNSMVGYVVGLGDRHSSNILLDKTTAEMIHIDLGVAFEQGKCLKTPETIPFRLTRDIEDGFGACGVEGVMRRCSEETLRVLRQNKSALTTVVAVLVHDPILKWAVSPERAARRQRGDDADPGDRHGEGQHSRKGNGASATTRKRDGAGDAVAGDQNATREGNLDAERALMRVAAKLDGYEGGELRSVAGQVQQLLQDARDPDLLCALYPGWAAWV